MAEDRLIVEMQAGGSKDPFWLLHPLGGNVLFGHKFAALLPREQPLLAIQARGLDGHSAPFTSLPEAARHYVELLLERQPRGPYYLGGPSFGGNLAYEMAGLLEASGARVGMVALFDAYGPGYPRAVPLAQRARNHVRHLFSRGNGNAAPLRGPEALYAETRIPAGNSEALQTLRRVTLAHEHAMRTHRPRPYRGRLHLFRASTAPEWPGMLFDDPSNGWAQLARAGMDIIAVPGSHQYILDPPWVDSLVTEFARALRKAQDLHSPARPETVHLSTPGE